MKAQLEEIVLPIGWNALLNSEAKTALVIGQYTTPGKANTRLELLSMNTKAELDAAIVALEYTPVIPPPHTPPGA
jgi:hypothetical protein